MTSALQAGLPKGFLDQVSWFSTTKKCVVNRYLFGLENWFLFRETLVSNLFFSYLSFSTLCEREAQYEVRLRISCSINSIDKLSYIHIFVENTRSSKSALYILLNHLPQECRCQSLHSPSLYSRSIFGSNLVAPIS